MRCVPDCDGGEGLHETRFSCSSAASWALQERVGVRLGLDFKLPRRDCGGWGSSRKGLNNPKRLVEVIRATVGFPQWEK